MMPSSWHAAGTSSFSAAGVVDDPAAHKKVISTEHAKPATLDIQLLPVRSKHKSFRRSRTIFCLWPSTGAAGAATGIFETASSSPSQRCCRNGGSMELMVGHLFFVFVRIVLYRDKWRKSDVSFVHCHYACTNPRYLWQDAWQARQYRDPIVGPTGNQTFAALSATCGGLLKGQPLSHGSTCRSVRHLTLHVMVRLAAFLESLARIRFRLCQQAL